MKDIRRVLWAFCLGVVSLSASAFWSWVGFGPLTAAHHQDYTAQAVGAPVTFTFAGKNSSSSGQPYSFSQHAIDQINLAHAQADDPANYQAVDHFDSEELVGGLLQIARRRQELNEVLTPPISAADQQNAWNLLGFMIHAIQDFYAHSSWIEEGNTDIVAVGTLKGFGALTENTSTPTIPPFFQVSVGVIANPAECGPAGYPLLPPVSKMTTGYYDPLSAPSGKCDHGTLAQAIGTCTAAGLPLIRVQGISKDSPCASYPLGPNHFTAASLAERETLNFVQSIVADLNSANNVQGFCALLDLQSNAMCGGSVALTANPTWVVAGATVTFSVVVPPPNGSVAIPTGTVLIKDETGSIVCSIALDINTATGTCSSIYSLAEPHTYVAAYSGDMTYPSANSAPVTTSPYAVSEISTSLIPTGVNSSGDIVGWNTISDTPVLDHAGQFIDLSTLALPSGYIATITTGEPVAISESGSIAEYACTTAATATNCDGFLLTPSNFAGFTASKIALPNGVTLIPTGVNSSGDVAGWNTSTDTPVLYHSLQFNNLSNLPQGYTATITNGEPVAISEAGLIAEYGCNPASSPSCGGFLWTPSKLTGYAISNVINSLLPTGVNSSGDIAGVDTSSDTPVLDHAGQFINLSTLGLPSGYTVTIGSGEPIAISESGSIAEYACTTAATATNCSGFLLKAPYVPQFPIVAMVSGLNGTLGLQNNMGSVISLTATSAATITVFPPMAIGSSYSITIASQPNMQTCSIKNGSGIVGGAVVIDVSVTCN